MNTKLVIYFILVLVIGFGVGWFSAPTADNTIVIDKTIDSLNVVNKVKDQVLDAFLKERLKGVNDIETKIFIRNENFKIDTTVIDSGELVKRARAIIDGK
ncbi:putative alpha-amylase [Cellulophaga phage phi39:1]|uniref:putative alpha-amylase n=1 Tax=Cellulophaga phage phi39:1 TaxID=1327993 RepID=UPI000351C38D|nr:putative alpha-amylase [Cellulophaga phage phi39:1]AGO49146.1 putative alpha-amylase [Cellulophaga phage phi39:1]